MSSRPTALDADHAGRLEQREAVGVFLQLEPGAVRDHHVRRAHRLAVDAYVRLTTARDCPPENSPSLATCERSPTPVGSGDTSLDAPVQDLLPWESDAVTTVYRRFGIDEAGRAAEAVRGGGDAITAIYEALDRCDERRRKVFALLERGEVSHALRLATCGRRSVQLECPPMAGGCGSDDNYVPIHCGSRLCPECQKRAIGHNLEKWSSRIAAMENPTFGTFTIKNVRDPVQGVEAIAGAFGRLRRRTIPFEGETRREGAVKRWCWWHDRGRPSERWKVRLQENGQHDLVRRLERKYVNHTYENITGVHRGRNIPFEELVSGGLYAVDVKQKGPDEFNVHLHTIMDMAFIPQAALASVWEDLTGDPVVDVRRIYDRGAQSIQQALTETVAYAVKPPEVESLEAAVDFTVAMKGKPLVHPFGSLHGNAARVDGLLRCAHCEAAPRWWNYCGVVEGAYDNMGKGWETDSDRPPPE